MTRSTRQLVNRPDGAALLIHRVRRRPHVESVALLARRDASGAAAQWQRLPAGRGSCS